MNKPCLVHRVHQTEPKKLQQETDINLIWQKHSSPVQLARIGLIRSNWSVHVLPFSPSPLLAADPIHFRPRNRRVRFGATPPWLAVRGAWTGKKPRQVKRGGTSQTHVDQKKTEAWTIYIERCHTDSCSFAVTDLHKVLHTLQQHAVHRPAFVAVAISVSPGSRSCSRDGKQGCAWRIEPWLESGMPIFRDLTAVSSRTV